MIAFILAISVFWLLAFLLLFVPMQSFAALLLVEFALGAYIVAVAVFPVRIVLYRVFLVATQAGQTIGKPIGLTPFCAVVKAVAIGTLHINNGAAQALVIVLALFVHLLAFWRFSLVLFAAKRAIAIVLTLTLYTLLASPVEDWMRFRALVFVAGTV